MHPSDCCLHVQVTRDTEVDQAGIVDGTSMLDRLQGQELTEHLSHILTRVRLSGSLKSWADDPGTTPCFSTFLWTHAAIYVHKLLSQSLTQHLQCILQLGMLMVPCIIC